LTSKLWSLTWTWDDEVSFMRSLGHRLDNYLAVCRKHRARTFGGHPVDSTFWANFTVAAHDARKLMELQHA
jgi:hypothetical protein